MPVRPAKRSPRLDDKYRWLQLQIYSSNIAIVTTEGSADSILYCSFCARESTMFIRVHERFVDFLSGCLNPDCLADCFGIHQFSYYSHYFKHISIDLNPLPDAQLPGY